MLTRDIGIPEVEQSRRPVNSLRGRGAVLIPLSRSTREAIRTNLWAVPMLMVGLVTLLLVITYNVDVRAAAGRLVLPGWITSGGPDVARQILIAIAAAVITVAGVVFCITILVLQLASQQFGPRMLRNFIRDIGTQVSLGAFVATFVFSVLALQPVCRSRAAPCASAAGARGWSGFAGSGTRALAGHQRHVYCSKLHRLVGRLSVPRLRTTVA